MIDFKYLLILKRFHWDVVLILTNSKETYSSVSGLFSV